MVKYPIFSRSNSQKPIQNPSKKQDSLDFLRISGCVDFGENTKIFSRSGPGSESSSRDLVRPMAKPGLPGASRKMGDFHGIWTPKMMRQMEFNHQKQWNIQTEVSSDLLSKRILFWEFHHIYIQNIYIYNYIYILYMYVYIGGSCELI